MFNDALAELDRLPASYAGEPAAMEMRIIILSQAHRWPEALAASDHLRQIMPDVPAGYIHAAFCLHELGRPAQAKALLLAGPLALRQEPTFYYNLACYECVLGNLDEARRLLAASVTMDEKYKEFAKTDPDLAKLRE